MNQEQMSALAVGDSYQTIPRSSSLLGMPPDINTVEVVKTSDATIWWKYQGTETVYQCRRARAYFSMPHAASKARLAEARLKTRIYKLVNLIEPAIKAARDSDDVVTLETVWSVLQDRKKP